MARLATAALRLVIAIALLGSLGVQTVMMPVVWHDLEGTDNWVRTAFVVSVTLGIVTLQVIALCIWRLLTLVRRGEALSRSAFPYVDTVIGSLFAGAVLMGSIAFVLAPGATPPGIVGLVCGAALVIGGVALVVLVQRTLLAQAVAQNAEVQELRTELNEVI
ncbi:MAG: DUF2975 domain-containing protein [Actinomycetota bacterium]|nr:DUF2975 domain-containing protein [Actinomycetota bacterium]